MTDTPASNSSASGAEFDMMAALDWKDGIATLPGSNIRFRMTEFGTLEIVTDPEPKDKEEESPCLQPESTPSNGSSEPPSHSNQSETATPRTCDVAPSGLQTQTGSSSTTSANREDRPNVEMVSCKSCGHSGSRESFLQGKFCSSGCVQPSSGRSTPGDTGEGERLGKRIRKKKKMFMESEDDEEDNIEEEEEKFRVSKGRKAAKLARLVTAAPAKKKAWSWPAFLEEEKAVAAPLKLFKEHQAFPQSRNAFKVGMKLEGLDPCHPAFFCVLTVAEVQGYRTRLHFDGYPECYDFWVNADSWDVKPPGWCEKMGLKLLLPKGCKDGEFNWNTYVKNCRGQLAPKHCFKSLNTSVTPSGFRAGMKLEAVDRKNPSLICVATISAVVDNRLLIHFDNWDDTYDYWCDASSPYIHPVGYCEETELTLTTPAEKLLRTHITSNAVEEQAQVLLLSAKSSHSCRRHILTKIGLMKIGKRPGDHQLSGFDELMFLPGRSGTRCGLPPQEYKQPNSFSWEKYLEETGTQAAPARAFKQRPPHGFQLGMKVEAVDKRNPMLIRVTTISDTEDHRVKIHFDGWSDEYDYWVDADSPDLHPVGWCQKTGHPLQNPSSSDPQVPPGQGCPTSGCNGVGHIKGPRYGTHYTAVSCPYSELNLNKEGLLPDRLSGERPVTLSGPTRHRRTESVTQTPSATPTPTPTPTGSNPESNENMDNPSPTKTATAAKCTKPNQVKNEGNGKVDSLQQFLHDSVFCGWEPPKFQHCWEKHGKLLPEALGLSAKTVAKWSTDEVAGFVRKLPGCREHAAIFRNEQIDGEAFLLLTQSDIVKILSIKLGPALKIYNCILMLRSVDEE
ncbi:lethal(3)malignant brain tumor-like protein 1 isoform X2 [Hemibagrus wyckioides]|uniref:lethal(3)malignant brain tumor-like protein 1 isoform X2 n=1 Tax=Hemibagrus wyckioides TaxID=337641 RepID=UPI00266C5DD0|nr:lethal(3)malignant brain tumor-like protein 1 isoform X2 [Hemibagrus wyckioides]